jgi:tRNA(adenine34) deaminase
MSEAKPSLRYNETSDVAFMQLALEQARFAGSLGEVPIGAVVVSEGVVVAAGHNRREIDADPSAHAEFSALIAASKRLGRWRLTGCTVYVTLEPCLMCAGLMQLSRVDRCVFGAFDPKGGALGTLYELHRDERLNHRFEVTAGVCEQECSALLSEFFARLRANRKTEGGTL